DDDVEELDMDNLDTKIWLVKIPKFLAEKWTQASDTSVDLGKVRIYDQDDAAGQRLAILLSDTPQNADIPKEYTLKITNSRVTNAYVFSENNKTHHTAVTGTIHHECAVTPVISDAYRHIMRTRNLEAGKPVRSVQRLGDIYRKPILASSMQDHAAANRKKTTYIESKMTRMPKQDLMNMLFKAFEKYPYWSLKGLVEHTEQPVAFLKEVLNEVAILNRKGGYSANYQLKPEF
ncbi:transcription initiation factor IIF, beta subunit, partial [Dimargaris cristalligena]